MTPLRLLLIVHDVSGGTETLCRHLVALLPSRIQHLVVACPRYRIPAWVSAYPPGPHLVYESFEWPEAGLAWFPARIAGIVQRAKRASPNLAHPALRPAEDALLDARLRSIMRAHRLDHALVTWILAQTPPRLDGPFSIIFQDLNYRHSEASRTALGMSLQDLDNLYRAWLAAARRIFPISESAVAELLDFTPEHRAKTLPIPLGAAPKSPETLAAARAHPFASELRAWARGPLFYYPANVYPHKCHAVLLDAFAAFLANGGQGSLLLTGRETETLTLPESGGRIRALGLIGYEAVAAAYSAADCIVLPSRYEGFGLPLVEAMEWGKPVLCSDIPVFREQLKRYAYAATVFAPKDPAALATALRSWSVSAPPQPANLAAWTWADCADAYARELAAP